MGDRLGPREGRESGEERKALREGEKGVTRRETDGPDQPSGTGGPVRRKFLQKHHHKGAFYMETEKPGVLKEEVYRRDFNEATGMDRGFDKSCLPEVMQKRDFGRKSNTKWSHLSKEDTTQRARDSLWTTGTSSDGYRGSAKTRANLTYDQTHFTNAHAGSKPRLLGSANYGTRRVRDI